jgi:hypothetical protein
VLAVGCVEPVAAIALVPSRHAARDRLARVFVVLFVIAELVFGSGYGGPSPRATVAVQSATRDRRAFMKGSPLVASAAERVQPPCGSAAAAVALAFHRLRLT